MLDNYLTTTGEIQRKTKVSDGAGGLYIEWLSIMTSRGRLDGIGGDTPFYADKRHSDSTHVWICKAFEQTIEDITDQYNYFGAPFAVAPTGSLIPVNIDEGDRMMINGAYYRMTFIDDPMNFSLINPVGVLQHLEIELKRWENDG